jgi:hypothetical protein
MGLRGDYFYQYCINGLEAHMNSGIFEAQRLLRQIKDRDPECARLVVQAIEQIAAAAPDMPVKYVLLQIHSALPGAAFTDKERKLLCPKRLLSSMEGSQQSSTMADQ